MSLWGWVGLAVAEGLAASKGGSLADIVLVSMRPFCGKSSRVTGTGRGTHGRKLQAEDGRLATRVNISAMSRCCTLVSWLGFQRWFRKKPRGMEPWRDKMQSLPAGYRTS